MRVTNYELSNVLIHEQIDGKDRIIKEWEEKDRIVNGDTERKIEKEKRKMEALQIKFPHTISSSH